METQNPATPAQAATPGKNEQGQTNPSTATSNITGKEGEQSGGQVTISAEEFSNLNRDRARLQSFQKRRDFWATKNNPNQQRTNFEGADPDVLDTLTKTQEALQQAETRALRAEVRTRVNDILVKPEYAKLPESTKNLIRQNPAMLSNADNIEEAMLDIEDFIREESAKISVNAAENGQPNTGSQPGNVDHETPPTVTGATPASVDAQSQEDTSKLSGPARSQAVLRNLLKKNRG